MSDRREQDWAAFEAALADFRQALRGAVREHWPGLLIAWLAVVSVGVAVQVMAVAFDWTLP